MAESLIMLAKEGEHWFWTRYLIRGTRLTPHDIAWHRQTMSTEEVCEEWELTPEQVDAAVRWCERRRAGGRKAWATRRGRADGGHAPP
jgi:hypothetical protein